MSASAAARRLSPDPTLRWWAATLERDRFAQLAASAGGAGVGESVTWPAAFEELRRLQVVSRIGTPLEDGTEDPVRWAQLQLDRQANAPAAAALERRLHGFYVAWRQAEADYAGALRASPAFALPTDPAERSPRRRPPRMDPDQRARQRHRYKGAMADALELFARRHLRRDPRAGILRERWLDHRHDCRAGIELGARCPGGAAGCARIRLPPPPRWSRSARRRRKRDSVTVAEWLIDRAAGVRSCQDVIALRDDRCGGVMVMPQSCHVRTCPDCEAARQASVVRTYRAAVEELDPDRARFVTLTKRNPPRGELAAGLAELADAAERLRRRAIWKGGRCRDRGSCPDARRSRAHRRECAGEQCGSWQPGTCRQPWDPAKPGWRLPHEPVTASLTTTEVTYNDKSRTWHPHLHALIEAGYIDQAELAATWQALTGDSKVVWVESVRTYADQRAGGDVEGALRELLKYAAKPHPAFLNRHDPAVVAELLVALRGRHMTAAGGRLYGRGLEDPEQERDLVLVWPEGEGAERPYHAPRVCPLHDGEAAWRVLPGTRRRIDCTAAPGREGRGRPIYTLKAEEVTNHAPIA